jgi:hypothetical protein
MTWAFGLGFCVCLLPVVQQGRRRVVFKTGFVSTAVVPKPLQVDRCTVLSAPSCRFSFQQWQRSVHAVHLLVKLQQARS